MLYLQLNYHIFRGFTLAFIIKFLTYCLSLILSGKIEKISLHTNWSYCQNFYLFSFLFKMHYSIRVSWLTCFTDFFIILRFLHKLLILWLNIMNRFGFHGIRWIYRTVDMPHVGYAATVDMPQRSLCRNGGYIPQRWLCRIWIINFDLILN